MKYYIAYGSNLNVGQMGWRCPDAVPVGTAFIKDYTLRFRGSMTGSYLTIEPEEGSKVPVGIWKVSAEDERHLDRYEGFPNFYYKKDFILDVDNGREVKSMKCFAYIMTEGREEGTPSLMYMRTCLAGYKDFGFDQRFLRRAYEHTVKR